MVDQLQRREHQRRGRPGLQVDDAIREDIMSSQSLISTMLSGWRSFKDDRP